MAVVTTLTGGTIPGAGTSSTGWNLAGGTILASTANTFSWQGADGHIVTLIGNFTYAGGPGTEPDTTSTVSEARFDTFGDGSVDMTVDYGAAPINYSSLLSFGYSSQFFRGYFLGADTMTFASGDTLSAFSADVFDGSFATAQSDTLTITGAGSYSGDYHQNVTATASDTFIIDGATGRIDLYGDAFRELYTTTSRTIDYAGDTFTDNTTTRSDYLYIYCDVGTLDGDLLTVNGGDDVVTSASNSTFQTYVYGDVGNVHTSNSTLNGGDDQITVTNTTGVQISGDFRQALSLLSTNNLLIGGNDTITAGDGPNRIWGDIEELQGSNSFAGGDDTITSGAGDDFLYGDYESIDPTVIVISGGNDTINAGAGNDTVYGNEGNDILNGEDDDDFLVGGAGDDTITGGDGIDTVSFAGSAAGVTLTLNGATNATATGDGTDTINTVENIVGSAHADTLTGDTLNNTIEGGDGDDTLNGAGGNQDVVSYASASAGVTVDLRLTTAQDTIGAGIDTLSNFEGIIGSDHNDVLYGNNASNRIEGNDGDDIILVMSTGTATGADQFYGGEGSDIIGFGLGTVGVTTPTTGHYFDAGDLYDTSYGYSDTFVFETFAIGFEVDLVAETFKRASDGMQAAQIVNFENVYGGSGDDLIYGSSEENMLLGGAGNDLLRGGYGNDILDGGTGDGDRADFSDLNAAVTLTLAGAADAFATSGAWTDTVRNIENVTGTDYADTLSGDGGANQLDGNAGNDTLNGNAGNDTLNGGDGSDTLNGGAGFDTLRGGGDADELHGGNQADTLYGDDGDDTLNGDGGADNLFGGAQNDTLNGGDGNDILSGQAGFDTLHGDGGNDTLSGGDQADTLYGDDGDDTLNGDGGADNLFGGAQNDTLNGGDGNDILNGQAGFDTLHGDGGNDTLNGGDQADTLYGDDGDDTLNGDGGADNLYGGNQNDTLNGGAGNDTLNGQAGFDILVGGTGNDTLTGGAQADTFVFEDGFGADTITDFAATNNAEKIDLSAVTSIVDWLDLSTPANGHMYQSGADVIIDDLAGNTIALTGINIGDLDAADFIF